MIISAIAAIGENRELGKNNRLLWHIPEDLKRFKVLTLGHPIIMGRKTYESIGRPLPQRINIIITRNPDFKAQGCIVVGSIEEAIAKAKEHDQKEIFIIGGGEIYKQALPLIDKLYLTVVKGSFEADVFFPDYSEFSKIIKQENGKFENYAISYIELTR